MTTRCKWPGNDPLYIEYHDKEWGVPLYDERALFEFLCLECQQAGLSWITVRYWLRPWCLFSRSIPPAHWRPAC